MFGNCSPEEFFITLSLVLGIQSDDCNSYMILTSGLVFHYSAVIMHNLLMFIPYVKKKDMEGVAAVAMSWKFKFLACK